MFKIGPTCFGIETAYVKSITKNLESVCHEFPTALAEGKGIVGYDGRKICVVDLEKRFFTSTDKGIDTCHETEFIVVSFEGNGFAIPIGEIADIFQVSEKDISPIPAFAVRYMPRNFFKGVFAVGDKLILILDVGKLLN
ncbi:MAG TPA: chemotaxis protein CheW [Candidatus Wunengus sp. YC60]|uniref:chemotaxis protein CheW n=1 Tax=Candidatus Wunengus sp. YC60 TaxID=3367697 RepID=UPI004028AAB2